MVTTHLAYIGIGSNLNHPQQQVTDAITQLRQLADTELHQCSSLYQSAPVGYKNQPDFINAVAAVYTTLSPQVLFIALQRIEQQAGRKRSFQNAPRTLDLDLLLYDTLELNTASLVLPHPRVHQRAFTLLPLLEIAPHLIIPGQGRITTLIQNCTHQAINKLNV